MLIPGCTTMEQLRHKSPLAMIRALDRKEAENICENISAHSPHNKDLAIQLHILEDHIRIEMLEGRERYLMKMEEVMMRQRTGKFINKSEGACSETKFHQSDDQKRKEMLEKKATEERFPNFVW